MIKNKLFILEDNEVTMVMIKGFFESKGFEVHGFFSKENLHKGIEAFGLPDVLVTDYLLQNGETSLDLVENLRNKIKVIVCTTVLFDDEAIRLKLYLNGCVDVKPKNMLKQLYTSVIQALQDEPKWVKSAN